MRGEKLYRLVAGRRTGPYEAEELIPLVDDGRISTLDRFSYDGESWQPLASFPELTGRQTTSVLGPPPCPAVNHRKDVAVRPDGHKRRTYHYSVASLGGLIVLAGCVMWAALSENTLGKKDIPQQLLADPTSLQGQELVLEAYYLPNALRPLPEGSYAIGLALGRDDATTLSGADDSDFLVLVDDTIGERLMLSTGLLKTRQPARVTLAVGVEADTTWPSAECIDVSFFKTWPVNESTESFLRLSRATNQ